MMIISCDNRTYILGMNRKVGKLVDSVEIFSVGGWTLLI